MRIERFTQGSRKLLGRNSSVRIPSFNTEQERAKKKECEREPERADDAVTAEPIAVAVRERIANSIAKGRRLIETFGG
jgi:hypothetical protein